MEPESQPRADMTGREATSRRRSARRWFVRVAFMAGVTMLLLAGLEFRLARLARHERPWIPFSSEALQPGSTAHRSQIPGLEFRFQPSTTNTQGDPGHAWAFRDTHLRIPENGETLEHPADTYVITLVGDSLTEGYGVEAEERYSDRLETLLHGRAIETGRTVIVYNLAVAAMNVLPILATLEEAALRTSPDEVVYAFFANDVQRWKLLEQGDDNAVSRSCIPRGEAPWDPALDPPTSVDALELWLHRSSHLYHQFHFYTAPVLRQRLTTPLGRLVTDRLPAMRPWLSGTAFGSTTTFCDDPRFTAMAIERMAHSVRAAGATFRVLHIPVLEDVFQDQPDRASEVLHWFAAQHPEVDVYPLRPALERAITEHAVTWPDLSVNFESDQVHLSPLGHRVVAQDLARHLLDTPEFSAWLEVDPK